MTYAEKLKDPRWQKKRLEILNRDKFECQGCGSTEKELHVHHCFYLKNTEPWDHPNKSLLTLCIDCHKETEFPSDYLEPLNILFKEKGFTTTNLEDVYRAIQLLDITDKYYFVRFLYTLVTTKGLSKKLYNKYPF